MLVGLAFFLLAAWPAGAVPYAKIVDLQLDFEKSPASQRNKLILHVKLVHVDHADHSPIRLWVVDGGQRTEVPLGPDGALPDVPRKDWADRGLQAETDQKPHTLQTEAELLIRLPGGDLTTAYLHDASEQAQLAITNTARQMGGFLASFAAPTVRGVTLKLAGCCDGTVKLPSVMLTQDKKGNVVIPLSALTTSPTHIAVTAPILSIDPTTD